MKTITVLFVGIFFFFHCSIAQVVTKMDSISVHEIKDTLPWPAPPSTNSNGEDNQIFTRVEQEAMFPGGPEGWKNYLEKNLNENVPVKKGAPVGRYTVIIRFIVGKDGHITAVETTTHNGYGMEEEVIRIIKKGPKWIPGMQNGRKVNSYRLQPVTFLVENQ